MPIWGQVLVGIGLLVGVLAIMWNIGMRREVKRIILALVIEAEKKFGDGTGPIKYDYVIGNIYPRLPFYVRMFVSEEQLDTLIEQAVTVMKDKLKSSIDLYDAFYSQP